VTGEGAEGGAGFREIGGLAVDPRSQGHDRVDAEDERVGLRGCCGRGRLAVGVLGYDLVRRPLGELLDVGDANLKGDPQLLEDRSPLRRARRED